MYPARASPFFAIPEMGPIRFREQKIGDVFAFGSPRSSCVRHVSVLRCASHYDMAPTNDLTPHRFPHVLSPPAMEQQTPTKHPGLRLRGGRRTPLRYAPFPVLLHRRPVNNQSQHNQSRHYAHDWLSRYREIKALEEERVAKLAK